MANTSPIFTRQPNQSSVTITAANTRSDGNGTIGTDIFLAFAADATNGSFVSRVRVMPQATVAATNTVATVFRLYISTQTSGATTSSNTRLIDERAMAIQAAASASVAAYPVEFPLNIALTPGETLLITSHAAPAANTSWVATALGGDY